MKIEVVLKPCPWCKKTPDLKLPIDADEADKTWCWTVICRTPGCGMKPESPHVNIRRGQKKQAGHIAFKLDALAVKWNNGNDYKAYEKKVIELEEIV
jgi:hypothetical protein